MKIYGDRGFVPAYIGNVKGMPNKDEKQKAENYLTRFLRGAYQNVVKLINSESLELVRVGAGMEELKGAYSEIQQQAIEDIGTAFGIPAALFMSDKAFASEVQSLTRTWYETSIFVSIYHTIEEVMSEQVFKPYGYRMQFAPEALSVFQEDENQRAGAVTAYTNAISSNPQVAKFVMSFMGVDLDQEQQDQFDAIIAEADEPEDEPEDEPTQPEPVDDAEDMDEEDTALTPDEVKDLSLWYSKAKAWNLKGKGNAVDWENKHLREEIAAPIRQRLAEAKNELDIVKAFEIGKQRKPAPVTQNEDGLKALAASIDAAVNAGTKTSGGENVNIIIDQHGNFIKQQESNAGTLLAAIKAIAEQNAAAGAKMDGIKQVLGTMPAPVVNVAAPVVNVPAPVVNVSAPNVKVTNEVKPADVVLPAMPTEATITTDARGNKTLKVKRG
jgi:hypothetical protein